MAVETDEPPKAGIAPHLPTEKELAAFFSGPDGTASRRESDYSVGSDAEHRRKKFCDSATLLVDHYTPLLLSATVRFGMCGLREYLLDPRCAGCALELLRRAVDAGREEDKLAATSCLLSSGSAPEKLLIAACQAHSDNGKILAAAMSVSAAVDNKDFRVAVMRGGLFKLATKAVLYHGWATCGPELIVVRSFALRERLMGHVPIPKLSRP